MGTKYKDVACSMTTEEYNSNNSVLMDMKDMMMNVDDSGNSCGSSVVSDLSGPSDQTDLFDGDGVQVSDLEEVDSLPISQCVSLSTSTQDLQRRSSMDSTNSQPLYHSNHSSISHSSGISCSSKDSSESQVRQAVLSYEQMCRLNDVMDEVVNIHGRGNFPTLEVRLRDLVNVVSAKLQADQAVGGAGLQVRDIRVNGGAASYVLAIESQPYNDLDLIFGVDLTNGRNYDRVKTAVLNSLLDLLPEGVNRKRISTCSLKEAYVSKMVKVNNDGDRWSLISLGNSRNSKNVELKFVDTMRRQFEFSVDSFQIILDSLMLFYECSTCPISENFYPTVVGESVYGDFQEALYHLQKKLISTRQPEEIRGGGLLKYCNLLVKNYRPWRADHIKTLQRYMCSRFFIDFPDIGQQRAKLENYLWNHFTAEEEYLKHPYLLTLHDVVEESTVCLMGHERRQTLALIDSLAWQVVCQEQQRLMQQQAAAVAAAQQVAPAQVQVQDASAAPMIYANGYLYPMSMYPCTCGTQWMACTAST